MDMKATKDGRLSSSHHFTPFGGDSDEEEPRDDYTVPQKVCYHSYWKRKQDAVYWVKKILSTRSRIAILADEVTCSHRERSCASRLHLQSSLSKRRSNTVRKTLNPTTRAKVTLKANCNSQQQSICDDVSTSTKTCTGEPMWDKRCQRLHNG